MNLKLKDNPLQYPEKIGIIQKDGKKYLVIHPTSYMDWTTKEYGYQMEACEVKTLEKEDILAINELIKFHIDVKSEDILDRIRSI